MIICALRFIANDYLFSIYFCYVGNAESRRIARLREQDARPHESEHDAHLRPYSQRTRERGVTGLANRINDKYTYA